LDHFADNSGWGKQRRHSGIVVIVNPKRRTAIMIEPKLEVPAELRDLAEKTIDQAEKAFGMFFDAASKSIASVPNPGTEISKQALSFTEQNMKAAFEHARKLVHATDLQQAMQIQSEFLRSQFTNAGEHMRQITGGIMSAAKDKDKLWSDGRGWIIPAHKIALHGFGWWIWVEGQVHDGPPGVTTRRPSSFLLIPVGHHRQGFAYGLPESVKQIPLEQMARNYVCGI
jgi:phasin